MLHRTEMKDSKTMKVKLKNMEKGTTREKKTEKIKRRGH